MDLSHWDLADDFSADEITDLMLGREPCHNLSAPEITNSPIYKIIKARTEWALEELLYHANHFYSVNVLDKNKLYSFTIKDSIAQELKLFKQSDVFEIVRKYDYMDNHYIKQVLDNMFENFERREKFIFSKQVLHIWNDMRNTLNIEGCFKAEWRELNAFNISKGDNENIYIVNDRFFQGLTEYYEFSGFEFKKEVDCFGSTIINQRFCRREVIRWIRDNDLKSIYQFNLTEKNMSIKPTPQEPIKLNARTQGTYEKIIRALLKELQNKGVDDSQYASIIIQNSALAGEAVPESTVYAKLKEIEKPKK